jgi:putative RNA 2'-phosphotransferase
MTRRPATDAKRLSKTLSYWLRHRPDAAALTLDAQGWTEVSAVLAALERQEGACDLPRLLAVVDTNDKQRFELSPDGLRIRARQGHSVDVSLDWPRRTPPAILYHGTVAAALSAILAEGLRPMRRHHVHLSPDAETARRVGARRGRPVILSVRAGDLDAAGQPFFLTANGVWLTSAVPPGYLQVDQSFRTLE